MRTLASKQLTHARPGRLDLPLPRTASYAVNAAANTRRGSQQNDAPRSGAPTYQNWPPCGP
jgi:hypothetical protein